MVPSEAFAAALWLVSMLSFLAFYLTDEKQAKTIERQQRYGEGQATTGRSRGCRQAAEEKRFARDRCCDQSNRQMLPRGFLLMAKEKRKIHLHKRAVTTAFPPPVDRSI